MKLEKNKDYSVEFPDGIRRAQFLCRAGKGFCKVADPHGKGAAFKIVPRDKIKRRELLDDAGVELARSEGMA